MPGHHHRSGALKQSNKKHKGGKHATKSMIAKVQGGKIEGKVSSGPKASSLASGAMQSNNKAMRLLKQKQHREKKREEVVLQRRFGSGSSLGPPKTVALIALGELADLSEIKASIFEGVAHVEEPVTNGLRNCTVGVFTQHKQKVCVIECGNDLLVAMDAAKVADIVVFVLPVHNGIDNALNVEGSKIISAIRAQGLPATIGCIQGLDGQTAKAQADLKKLGQRFFVTEFGESIKIAIHNVNNQLSRTIMTMALRTIHWRETRSYMLATAAAFTPNGPTDTERGTLQLSGYIRGKPMSVNQLIHITDVGTFQLSHITQGETKQTKVEQKLDMSDDMAAETAATSETVVLAQADPSVQEDLRMEAEYDPFAAEQTWPTKEELEEAERNAKQQKKSAKGMSDYQAAWLSGDEEEDEDNDMEDGDDEEQDEAIDQSFCKTKSEKGDDDDDDDDMSMDDEDDATRQRNMAELKEKRRLESENEEFPDEVDIPGDQSGRIRFARYRGIKSMRTSYWDPKESLPMDYARLFQFEDFAMVQRLALQRGKDAERVMKAELRRKNSVARSRAASVVSSAMEDVETESQSSVLNVPEFGNSGYIASGIFVTLHIKDVPLAAFQQRVQAGPLILGALLKHENRLSVLNFSIKRAATFEDPLKSKEPVVFHCGFRRYAGRPVFSDQSLKSDQHLFQRFLPQGGWSVASVYAPVTFQPASVLIFRENTMVPHELVATGSLMNVNPDRIVLKRVIITGTPVKVKKRKAVVRYMFHQPEDVRWFKPVELFTKHGMTGHIKESLGTHGDFKAVFNKPVKQHDTVCMPLYKRVYPKFVE
ncbi:hypothetical protein Poli38472_000773 [Pythium oligandrum]|uniref:Bms1-type G domain-containing protein n=1 Tax=Pythium oligandrum TaxID=41045 RepID=A0A8K1CD57_PYTOL|nr:hypothetical protein Poli38472_000773 [Pythium oligandrum]|eukprot:TMW60731.1 hypothetical protein Poli38472_000773 [Pythium oligandrum]